MTPEGTDLERLRAYANSAAGMYGKMLCDPSTIIALITRCLAAESALAEATKYMEHHAARAEKAESALAQAIAERDRMAEALTLADALAGVCHEIDTQHPQYPNCFLPRLEEAADAYRLRRASQALTTTEA